MVLYISLFFILLLFSLSNKYFDRNVYPLLLFTLFCLGVFRDETVGDDNMVYKANFLSTTFSENTWSQYTEFELGFSYCIALYKRYISNEYISFMVLIFVIHFTGIIYLVNKESNRPIQSLFFYYILFYFSSFNIMRQNMGLGLVCFFVPSLLNYGRKYLFIFLVSLISILFHRSLFILLLVPLIVKNGFLEKCVTKKKLYFIVILSFMCYMSKEALIPYFPNLDFIGERYSLYMLYATSSETVSLTNILFKLVFVLFVIKIYPFVRDGYFLLFIAGIVSFFILGMLSPTIVRASDNLLIFQVIFLPKLWKELYYTNHCKLYRLFVLCYLIPFFVNSIVKNYGGVIPYSTYLF